MVAKWWRVFVVVPFLVVSDAGALARETTTTATAMADKYATDTLLCRGPFNSRYVDTIHTMRVDENTVKGSLIVAHLEIDATFKAGTVGFGEKLARGQCGWLSGKNPEVTGVHMRGNWMDVHPLRRTIEQDATGKQTVKFDLPLHGNLTHSVLFSFKVPHQNGGGPGKNRVTTEFEPKLLFGVKFDTP